LRESDENILKELLSGNEIVRDKKVTYFFTLEKAIP